MRTRAQSRTLGYALIGFGGLIAVLAILWLLTATSTFGGFLLGLILALIIVVPLVGGGFYVLQRGQAIESEEQAFVTQSRILDADRLVRGELLRELGQQLERIDFLSRRPGEPALAEARARLNRIREDVERPAYANEAAWYEAVRLSHNEMASVERYDDLVLEQARVIDQELDRISNGTDSSEDLPSAIKRLELIWRQRNDLLLRGRQAARIGDILATPGLGTPGPAIDELRPGDALSYIGEDYVVQAKLDYFAGDRSWTMLQLAEPKAEHWLMVGPEPGGRYWLDSIKPVEIEQAPVVESGSATVSVSTTEQTMTGLFVEYSRRNQPGYDFAWFERWPNEERAYAGQRVRSEEVQVWPRITEPSS